MKVKSILAVLLSFVMLSSIISLPAFAVDIQLEEPIVPQEELTDNVFQEENDLLQISEDPQKIIDNSFESIDGSVLDSLTSELAVTDGEQAAVQVLFYCMPDTAIVHVYNELEEISAQEDGSYLLFPGNYFFTAAAEGYLSIEYQELVIDASTEVNASRLIWIELQPAEEQIISEEVFEAEESLPENVIPEDYLPVDIILEESTFTETEAGEEAGYFREGETGLPGVVLDASPISEGNYIWMGGIRWRVIRNSTNMDTAGRLLISADLLGGTLDWHSANDYCDAVFANFSSIEQNAVISTNKQDTSYSHYGTSALNGAKLFMLSADEVNSYFTGTNDRQPGGWWLRSPDNDENGYAGIVNIGNLLISANIEDSSRYGVRPAFNLNSDAVLFTTAAVGGKQEIIPSNQSTDWKLTILDPSRSAFTANIEGQLSAEITKGSYIPLSYSNAQTGDNEYLSVIVCDDSGTPIYYLGWLSYESDIQHFKMPSDISAGHYNLKVFNELRSGDNTTDYASPFIDISLTVKEEPISKYKLTLSLYEREETIIYSDDPIIQLPTPSRPGYAFAYWTDTSNMGKWFGGAEYNFEEFAYTNLRAVWAEYIGGIPACSDGFVYFGGILWRVIGTTKNKNLLISADVMGGQMYSYEISSYYDAVYNNFTNIEKDAVVETSDKESKLFSLSLEEILCYFSDERDRLPGGWWTASWFYRTWYHGIYFVSQDGSFGSITEGGGIFNGEYGVRPAFQLSLEKALFETAATGGKSSEKTGNGAFGSFRDGADGDRKLTMVDTSRSSFSAYVSGQNPASDSIEIAYTGAVSGRHEFVSAILCNSEGTPLYYASIPSEGSGTWTLTLPAGLTSGSYTLKVFNEQQNGDYLTDYASPMVEISLSATEKATGTLSIKQAGTVSGSALPAPEYVKPSAEGTEKISYSGMNTSGKSYGPSDVPPTEAGSYTVTVTYETADTVYTGSASFTITLKPSDDDPQKGELIKDDDGIYRYYENGVFVSLTGFVEYEGGVFCLKDGLIDPAANGLVNNPEHPDVWYFCSEGQAQLQYSGLAEYDGEWFYLTDGILNTTSVGVVTYDNGRFMIAAGRILREVNGLIQDPTTGAWYYVSAGQVADYTGLALYDEHWFYVIDGQLAVNFTGWVRYNGSEFYVTNGMLG